MTQYRVAIIGAGPAGYFAAQALQNSQNEDLRFSIDMIEKLPTPWGLVRSGVAPDHPKIKTVSKVFEKIATTEGFQLFCNVELGKDVSLAELESNYDAVVIATGSSRGKKLGIPGEDLAGSFSAAEFVPWYNAHPDFVDVNIDLSCDTAVVIGAGNVAMDVARMLALEPKELDPRILLSTHLKNFTPHQSVKYIFADAVAPNMQRLLRQSFVNFRNLNIQMCILIFIKFTKQKLALNRTVKFQKTLNQILMRCN